MTLQFRRDYTLTIENDEEKIVIRNLRVRFELTKTLLGYPNRGKIEIYNLSRENQARISKKYSKVTFVGGYEDNTKQVFQAQLINFYKSNIPPSRTFILILGSGQLSWQDSVFSRTYREGVAPATIIKEVVDSFEGVIPGNIETDPSWSPKLSGLTLTGSSKRLMDQLAKDYNFDWAETDGQIDVIPRGVALTDRPVHLITPFTGLIGSPVLTELGADFRTLLNPEMLPGRKLELRSEFAELAQSDLEFRQVETNADGVYKCMEIRMIGDTHERDWYNDIIAWRIGDVPTKDAD